MVAACNYQNDQEFCPVLLQIKHLSIMDDPDKPFILQVWNKKGIMLYEKLLEHPVCNWGISENKFMWQEIPGSGEIFLLKLFNDKRCQLHRILLMNLPFQ